MKFIILLLASLSLANGLEIPEQPHKECAFFVQIDPDGKGLREVQIFPDGSVSLPEDEKSRDPTVHISKEQAAAIYTLARRAALSAKIQEKVEGPNGRLVVVTFDFDGCSLHFNLNEKLLEKGIYDQLAEKIREIFKKYKEGR